MVSRTILLQPTPLVGPLTSGTVTIPAGILSVTLTLNLLPTDKLSVGLTASLTSEVSPDGGATWNPLASFGWTSYGPDGYTSGTLVNPDPRIRFNVPVELVGQLIRVTLDLPQPLTVGATIDITT